MKCENIFCIYYSDNKCLLDDVSLDIKGSCENCVLIDIEERQLEKHRKEILDRYEKW